MKPYRGVELMLHGFLTSALDGQSHTPAAFSDAGLTPAPIWTLLRREESLSPAENRAQLIVY
jgi:hypothetical protein